MIFELFLVCCKIFEVEISDKGGEKFMSLNFFQFGFEKKILSINIICNNNFMISKKIIISFSVNNKILMKKKWINNHF